MPRLRETGPRTWIDPMPYYHAVQLQIDEEWKTFYTLGCDFDFNCEEYRKLRIFFLCCGVNYPCRLLRVTRDEGTDGGVILTNQLKYPKVSDAITEYVEAGE